MSSKNRKRKSTSSSPEDLPSAKRQSRKNCGELSPKCVTFRQVPISPCLELCVYRPSKHCSECNKSITSERSHRAVCSRKEVSCVYPDPKSEGRGLSVVLRRVDGHFKCIRCEKMLKKDQNMKVCVSQIEHSVAKLTFIRTMLVNVTATAR